MKSGGSNQLHWDNLMSTAQLATPYVFCEWIKHWITTRRFLLWTQIFSSIVPSFYKVPCKILNNISCDTHLNIMPGHPCRPIWLSLLHKWVVKILSLPSFPLWSVSETSTTRFLAYLRDSGGDPIHFIILNEVMVVVSPTISQIDPTNECTTLINHN